MVLIHDVFDTVAELLPRTGSSHAAELLSELGVASTMALDTTSEFPVLSEGGRTVVPARSRHRPHSDEPLVLVDSGIRLSGQGDRHQLVMVRPVAALSGRLRRQAAT